MAPQGRAPVALHAAASDETPRWTARHLRRSLRAMSADPKQLAAEAAALKAAGKLDEAIAACRKVVALTPASAHAEHNLAAALADTGQWREAETHVRRALALGLDAPATWLILARALQMLDQLDEAEHAFERALARRPDTYAAQNELAQLRWMRTADVNVALAELENAIREAPRDTRLQVIKAQVLEQAGETAQAYALLIGLAKAHGDDVAIVGNAAQLASALGEDFEALAYAERAAALAPNEGPALVTLIGAHLALGHAERASAIAERLRALAPHDQHALALQATAWRLLGDPRYRTLYDYAAFVRAFTLDTPSAWPDLGAYLADLAPALRATHAFTTHPFQQSIKHGSQTSDVLSRDHPAIKALPQALDGPIKRYIAELGRGPDPLRARNFGGYAIQGLWSIRMSAGGFHIDHVHPRGWLSSACYIEVPQNLEGREGWLKFGEPGMRTKPPLPPEHFVEPVPGRLVLFPSYMWHGTVPFTDASARMTIAFDLSPAQGGGASG